MHVYHHVLLQPFVRLCFHRCPSVEFVPNDTVTFMSSISALSIRRCICQLITSCAPHSSCRVSSICSVRSSETSEVPCSKGRRGWYPRTWTVKHHAGQLKTCVGVVMINTNSQTTQSTRRWKVKHREQTQQTTNFSIFVMVICSVSVCLNMCAHFVSVRVFPYHQHTD